MSDDIETRACPGRAITQLRIKVAGSRTFSCQDYVYDKLTGECIGSYNRAIFSPDPIVEKANTPHYPKVLWDIMEDGSPVPQESKLQQHSFTAPVVELFPERQALPEKKQSKSGRKPQCIKNPLATAIYMLKVEGRPLSWLDDFAFGAIYTGPGVVGGKHSVALADVKKLLLLQEISVASAALVLLNHDKEPMSTRQLQRVVEAARVALRGIALHLERNPHILQSVDSTVDFEHLWARTTPKAKLPMGHPKKQQALEMLEAGGSFRTIANDLGLARNTVRAWARQAQAAQGSVTFD